MTGSEIAVAAVLTVVAGAAIYGGGKGIGGGLKDGYNASRNPTVPKKYDELFPEKPANEVYSAPLVTNTWLDTLSCVAPAVKCAYHFTKMAGYCLGYAVGKVAGAVAGLVSPSQPQSHASPQSTFAFYTRADNVKTPLVAPQAPGGYGT